MTPPDAPTFSRQPVALAHAYRLLNPGPTVLIGARHEGRSNVMAAAWTMPLDFEPPKVAVVMDKSTWTRQLVLASGHFVISVPCQAQAALVTRLGQTSGATVDKFDPAQTPALQTLDEPAATGPLVAGCVAWLACRRLPEPDIEARLDLFVGEVTAAWADPRVFSQGRWHFDAAPEALRTLHHVAGGHYLAIGQPVAGA